MSPTMDEYPERITSAPFPQFCQVELRTYWNDGGEPERMKGTLMPSRGDRGSKYANIMPDKLQPLDASIRTGHPLLFELGPVIGQGDLNKARIVGRRVLAYVGPGTLH